MEQGLAPLLAAAVAEDRGEDHVVPAAIVIKVGVPFEQMR